MKRRLYMPAPWVMRLGVIVILLAAWEVAGRNADQLFFRSFSEVVLASKTLILEETTRRAIIVTLWELVIAFALAMLFGIVIGLIVAANKLTYRTFYPILLLTYAIPQITVLPLFVLYFGPGPASKVAFGFSHGIYPIMLNVIGGVQGISPLLLRSARSMGASRWQTFKWISFPHMVPSLFTGMRLGMTATLLGVLLGELYVTAGGVGFFTRQFTETLQPDRLYALIGILAILAIVINKSIRRAELRFSSWR